MKLGRPRIRLAFLALVLPGYAYAETRWCSVGVRDMPKGGIVYPPIARAAHLTGTVIERVTFTPGGDVLEVDTVLGPKLIAEPVGNQLRTWRLTTNAQGAEACQALVIADFAFDDQPLAAAVVKGSSLYRVSVRIVSIVLDDPMYGVTSKH